MLDCFNLEPAVKAQQQAQEKRKLFWLRVKFVLGAFFVTLFGCFFSNYFDEPWAGASHMDRQGNLVIEPDWPVALAVSLILSVVVAGGALRACTRGNRHDKT